MARPPARAAGPLLVLLLLACSHSDPTGAGQNYLSDQPFDPDEPTRLTWSPLLDSRPYFSPGGTYLAYGAGRGPAGQRPDLCLAVLPGTGGQQQLLQCEHTPDDVTWTEAVEFAAVNDDGRVAFTRHGSGRGNVGASRKGLYLTQIGSTDAITELMSLGTFPPGAPAAWDYLLGMTWTGPDEVTAMATGALILAHCPLCPIDTVYTGSQVVRIRTNVVPVTWSAIGDAGGASAMAVDVSAGQAYLQRGNEIYRMPLAGGEAVLVHTTPPISNTVADTLSAIAAGGGALYYARHTLVQIGPTQSPIYAIYKATSASTADLVFLSGAVRLGNHITVTGDGRHLAFEGIVLGNHDIYRIEVTP